jgi:hypothetical protein
LTAKYQHLDSMKKFLAENLLDVSDTKKKALPKILSKPNVSIFTFATKDYLIFSFIDSVERKRIEDLKERRIHPFPFLIRPTNSKGFVFFNLKGVRNFQLGKLALQDGYGFSLGGDCTLVVDEVKQTGEMKDIGKYEYIIDLAYVISFGDEITGKTIPKYLEDLVVYSLKNWGFSQ